MTVWEIYFCTIAGFQYHPANPSEIRMSLEDCAKVCDEMVKISEERKRCQHYGEQ
jgi:hypothetical protein